MNRLLIALLLMGGSLMAQQQDSTMSFSLQEVQNYAITHSKTVENAKLDVNIAKKKVWETTTIGLPQVKGSVNYQNIFDVQTIQIMGGPPIEMGVKENITYDVTVSQLIFSGEYIVGLQTSKVFKQLSQQGLRKSEADVKELVTQTYYLVLVAQENKTILESNLENVIKILEEVTKMHEAGFTEDTDVDQLRLTVSNLKNALSSINRQVEVSKRLLKFQMGLELGQEINLSENLEAIVENANVDVILSQQFSLDDHIDYQLLSTQERLSLMSYRREKTTFLPSIAAFYKYSGQKDEPAFNFINPNMIGVSVSIPIFGSGQKIVKVQQAKMALEKAQNTKAQVAEGLLLGVQQAKSDAQSTLETFYNEKENLELTQRIYDKTAIKYKEGMSSSLDLTQAHNQLLTTQGNYFKSIFELLNAKNKLNKSLNNY